MSFLLAQQTKDAIFSTSSCVGTLLYKVNNFELLYMIDNSPLVVLCSSPLTLSGQGKTRRFASKVHCRAMLASQSLWSLRYANRKNLIQSRNLNAHFQSSSPRSIMIHAYIKETHNKPHCSDSAEPNLSQRSEARKRKVGSHHASKVLDRSGCHLKLSS